MKSETQSECLCIDPHLKRAFKVRCAEGGRMMAGVIVGLIEGWILGRFAVEVPPETAPAQTIYVPAKAHKMLRDRCLGADRKMPMRKVIEALIAGWLDGQYRLPPKAP